MSALPLPAAPTLAAGRRMIDDGFLDDPYPAYAALREAGPIHWSDEFFDGAWLLTRHEDVEAILRDPRFSARRTGGWVMNSGEGARGELKGFQQLFGRAMLFMDEPDHSRLRRLMHAGFRPDALRALRPYVEALVDEMLESVDARRGFDFMRQIARPLPARVIAKLMGIAGDGDDRFIDWSDDLAAFIGAPRPTLEQARRAQVSLLGMSRYFERCIASGAAGDGLVGSLARAARDGTIADDAELLAQCAMLLFAGHETTRNLLGNGLYHLLAQPGLRDALQREPDRLTGAVRELLRFDSPVQYTGRRVATDLVLHGQPLRRGELVLGIIGAANRDPRRYADPDRLDIGRRAFAPLSFGSGPHVCIGAALTMMEAEIVFGTLMRRWPELVLSAPRPRWNRNPVYRGLQTLNVHVPGGIGTV
ncbi:cytochrome P450 [Burkholderia guangdongensis]|uniref:cytochrome P450 n=1 Tax=Burkholderia guangdongensis TaxID=1792500 RepID=UPI0015C6FCBA|nr:cytochrome P450 [Burkholderia guangdongensis]